MPERDIVRIEETNITLEPSLPTFQQGLLVLNGTETRHRDSASDRYSKDRGS